MTTISYSSLAGSSKKGQQLKTAVDPQQALQQLASRKGKRAAIPEEKRKAIEDREKWATAERQSSGGKERSKSKKDWDEEREQVTAAMAARQRKPNDNVATRKERKNDKRKGLSKKARLSFSHLFFFRLFVASAVRWRLGPCLTSSFSSRHPLNHWNSPIEYQKQFQFEPLGTFGVH
ncbi:hypothetical protein BYT27DRAFT_7215695 [Phlegmacium glaucopus]|nr:hypothetical protein BYT27DRAFT_7215695 [Phlegmacium glaucopus]